MKAPDSRLGPSVVSIPATPPSMKFRTSRPPFQLWDSPTRGPGSIFEGQDPQRCCKAGGTRRVTFDPADAAQLPQAVPLNCQCAPCIPPNSPAAALSLVPCAVPSLEGPAMADSAAGGSEHSARTTRTAGSGARDPCSSPRQPAQDAAAAAQGASLRGEQQRACRVPGCCEPLKAGYGSKYRICAVHYATPCLMLDGEAHRFCQQASPGQGAPSAPQRVASCWGRAWRRGGQPGRAPHARAGM